MAFDAQVTEFVATLDHLSPTFVRRELTRWLRDLDSQPEQQAALAHVAQAPFRHPPTGTEFACLDALQRAHGDDAAFAVEPPPSVEPFRENIRNLPAPLVVTFVLEPLQASEAIPVESASAMVTAEWVEAVMFNLLRRAPPCSRCSPEL